MADFGDSEVTEKVLQEMINYSPNDPDDTLISFKKWQERLKKTERRVATVRDYLLMILGSRLEIKRPQERFLVTKMGMDIADENLKELELDEEKFKLLKRIIENNKIYRQNNITGQMEEVELFIPYEAGQLILALEKQNESDEKNKKDK